MGNTLVTLAQACAAEGDARWMQTVPLETGLELTTGPAHTHWHHR